MIEIMKKEDAIARAKIFRALGNPIRLMMLDELSRRECCVNETRTFARVDQSVVSRHLAQLKQAGIISERRAGRRVMHRLEYRGVLEAMEIVSGLLRSDAARRARLAGGD